MQCEKCGNEVENPENCPHCSQQGYPGHHGHVHHHPPTSGLAVASMILGILSPIFWILTAIPGLILGIFGLTKINMGCRRGKGMAVSGIALSGISIFCPVFLALGFLVIGMTVPAVGKAREKARIIACSSNLKQIALATKQYAMDNRDWFPEKYGYAGFKELIDGDYIDSKLIKCPSCDSPDKTDYVFLGGYMEGSSDQYGHADSPVAFDKPGNHKGIINIFYQDGRVYAFATNAKTATELVSQLQMQYNFPPAHFKILLEKAAKADKEQLKL
tara:strand:+ start:552 stop:1370 length:819 start_codon:yes stop_codon:yes gene_type:complete